MGDPETLLIIGFGIMIALFVVMMAVGLPRGKRMQKINEQIAANQAQQIALHERQVAALERIATASERRG